MIDIDDDSMRSDLSVHTGMRVTEDAWLLSWLPDRHLVENSALEEMLIGDEVAGKSPKPEVPSLDWIRKWGDLGMNCDDADGAIRAQAPFKRTAAVRCGAQGQRRRPGVSSPLRRWSLQGASK